MLSSAKTRGRSEMKGGALRQALLLAPRGITKWELAEAHALCSSAGYEVVDVMFYRRVSSSRMLSDAKLEELKDRVGKLRNSYEPRIIVFDDLKPREYFEIWKRTGLEPIDRTMLILEIFALHAGSREAKLQVEMARLRHQIPIVREAVRLSKMGELPGFLGPGGYAVDAYYRYVVSRVARIRRELEKLRERRRREREKRSSVGLPHVAIVGYASAGKTTVFNRLTGEGKPVGPEYFTTVYPKVKAAVIGGTRAAFVDTVGFISRIPPEIIEAFHSTLEEVALADAVLYVLDASEPHTVVLSKLVEGIETLRRIGVVGKPMVIALNKLDLVKGGIRDLARSVERLSSDLYPATSAVIPISAKTGYGMDELKCAVASQLRGTERSMC